MVVSTRGGSRKKAVEEASKAVEEASKAVEEASASNPAVVETSANPAVVEDSASNPALEEDGEERELGEAAIAAVLDSLRDQDDVRESPEELPSLGEGERESETVRVAAAANTEEDEDGGDGSGSKYVESSNREDEEGRKLDVFEYPDEEPAAMLPLGMYFPPSEYQKKIKISTRCHIYETVNKLQEGLEHKLSTRELDWFEKHPQFKHMFHMKRDPTHKVMAMWMLLLRTARIDKNKEVWFVVNGVPIRYSLREHALISGLHCRCYPIKYEGAGSDRFKNKHFKGMKKITIEDVRKELEEMVPDGSDDRLKMAVLYFLSTIIVGQTKNSGKQASGLDKFCLRVVDDLNFCTTFPWGRYSFEYMLRSISHTMSHYGGFVEGLNHPVPGFCIPLELLAFEAIPKLGNEFLEETPDADESCPRMCRRQFKPINKTGWPLEEIYEELGTTTEITSVLTANDEEIPLLEGLMEQGEEDDKYDAVVASWMRRIERGLTVSFQDMYDEDVASRLEQKNDNVVEDDQQPRIDTIEEDLKEDFQKQMQKMKEEMQTQMDNMKEEMQTQVDNLQTQVEYLQKQLDNEQETSKDPGTASTSAEGGSKKKKRKREAKDGKSKKLQNSKKSQD